MVWRDTLRELRDDLSEIRAQRQSDMQADEKAQQAQRLELTRIAESLGLTGLLQEMNSVLLNGQGEVENIFSWEEEEEEDSEESLPMPGNLEELEDSDYVNAILTWEEDGEREIVLDLGFGEQGMSLLVNGVDIRLEQEALEQALVEAFRQQLEV
ncbi:MAG: hypothetical protein IH870_05310 [Chloroflexi bacterium]|nr:hypothetical protein [Chloroflexota bacterium]